jgi:hypothetical protein
MSAAWCCSKGMHCTSTPHCPLTFVFRLVISLVITHLITALCSMSLHGVTRSKRETVLMLKNNISGRFVYANQDHFSLTVVIGVLHISSISRLKHSSQLGASQSITTRMTSTSIYQISIWLNETSWDWFVQLAWRCSVRPYFLHGLSITDNKGAVLVTAQGTFPSNSSS